jgi:hypothetical protein
MMLKQSIINDHFHIFIFSSCLSRLLRNLFANYQSNLNKLIDAVKISGVTKLIINKCDILDKIHTYKLYQNNSLYKFNILQAMQSFIKSYITHNINDHIEVLFSGNKEFL